MEVTSSFTSRVVGVPGERHDEELPGAAPAQLSGRFVALKRAGLEGRGCARMSCKQHLHALPGHSVRQVGLAMWM